MDSGYANKEQCQKWLNELPAECCLQCRFYKINDNAELNVYKFPHATVEAVSVPGECRKKSPSLVQLDGEFQEMFPPIDADEWCGDFVPNEQPRGLLEVCSNPFDDEPWWQKADQC